MAVQDIRRPLIPNPGDSAYNVAHTLRLLLNAMQIYSVSVAGAATSKAITFTAPFPTTDYAVIALPDWSTTTYYSAKAVGSVTINFGTAAPGSQALSVILIGG